MGGQACVFYGAAEFSRDLDLLVLVESVNLDLLLGALNELGAELIAVPPFAADHLLRGHALHYRCGREDVKGLRIDLMANMRGVADFEQLWSRRRVIEIEGVSIDTMAIEDLVCAKKTQRSKDWPMIERLVEQSYFRRIGTAEFWLRELRTPEVLIEATAAHAELANEIALTRPAVAAALTGDFDATSEALMQEEAEEKRKDRIWWQPLRAELEQFRHAKLKSTPSQSTPSQSPPRDSLQ
jgi:hypothetical protein